MTQNNPIQNALRDVGIEPLSNNEMRKKYGVGWPGSLPTEIPIKDLEKMLINGEGEIRGFNCEIWRGAGNLVQIRAYDGDNKYIASYDSETGRLIENKREGL